LEHEDSKRGLAGAPLADDDIVSASPFAVRRQDGINRRRNRDRRLVGPQAFDLINYLTPNAVAKLKNGPIVIN